MLIAPLGALSVTDLFQRSKVILPPPDPLLTISSGYGVPVAATYRVPPRLVSVTPTAFWPLIVFVPADASLPCDPSVLSISLLMFVSEASEEKLAELTEAFSHFPCSS